MIWAWILLEVEGHTRTDIKLLLVKGHWQLCGELTSVGYDCKTSVEAAGILNERMVIMQVVWFVGCILKGKPVGFIDEFDVSLEGCISRKRGRSLPEPLGCQYHLQGLRRRGKSRPSCLVIEAH